MLRHLRPILRSLSFLSALWKHNIKQIAARVKLQSLSVISRRGKWSSSVTFVFEENSDYLCLDLQKHFRNIIGRLLTISQISCFEQWRFLLAGAHRLLHKAPFLAMFALREKKPAGRVQIGPGHVYLVWTQCMTTGGLQKAHPHQHKPNHC